MKTKRNKDLESFSLKLKENKDELIKETFYNSDDFQIFKKHMEILSKK